MSAIIFISQSVPEKHLVSVTKYKGLLSPEEREKILKELRISEPDVMEKKGSKEEYSVTMHVEIEVRKYDTKNT